MKNFEEWLKENAFKDDVPMVEEGVNDSLWTNNVIKYQRMYEDYKANQPPKVRPMSELPKEGTVVDCLTIQLIDGTKFWAKADFNQNRFHIFYPDWDNLPFRFQENEVDFSDGEYNAVGWIPRLPLPNPNDIKL